MISIIRFNKKRPLDSVLLNYTGIYAIDSLIARDLQYGISGGKFAVLRSDGAVFCPVEEVPELAKKLIKPVAEEIMAIYEDIKDLVRMGVAI